MSLPLYTSVWTEQWGNPSKSRIKGAAISSYGASQHVHNYSSSLSLRFCVMLSCHCNKANRECVQGSRNRDMCCVTYESRRQFPAALLHIHFFLPLAPTLRELAPALEHRAEFPQFPDQGQSVGLLGRVISSSQGLYLYTNTEKRAHIHKH
jgi:hypothetical protein